MDAKQQRTAMLAQLEAALKLAENLREPTTAYLIERALDEARGQLFSSLPAEQYDTIN